ncbi:hypothetical protein NM208_g2720 [Fusarium decemcellulare]|uniref:Uncharacterized protein n=1 Tax=Fusarium decemcellulare TaxID=57161 RepID=A0ACC1SRF7_9HYPO|nr:hypothetical protein NM208_g2720 [Fusarium decemcellulare]
MTTVDADPIVVADDYDLDEVESCCPGEEGESSLGSARSVLDYRHENGRTYHRLPNDDEENDRLDLQHNLCLLTFDNKLGLSPPNLPGSNVQRVLDVGTGTGIWAVDFGDEHPDAEVIGIDLSPIQPTCIPPNVEFVIDDIEDDWDYLGEFDYVHSRFMNLSIQDWKGYLENIYKNLTPGGYVELQEVDVIMGCDDGTLTEDLTLYKWCRLFDEAAENIGRSFARTDKFKDIMTEVGFIDVVETRFKWPSNQWPKDPKYKELGAWNNENAKSALEALTLAPFTRGLGWTREQVDDYLVDLKRDFNDPKIHAYWPICAVYGRKPAV